MQLYIEDQVLYVYAFKRIVHSERLTPLPVVAWFRAAGLSTTVAEAVAYGALYERDTTIALAQRVRLLIK